MKRLFSIAAAVALSITALCSVSCRSVETNEDGNPIVKINTGKILGTTHDGIYSFKGVPYATGERFQPSVPMTAWEGVRDCTEYGPWAKQAENRGASEEYKGDFLLNVWTPGIKDKAKRPIMVWIHGGGFSTGGSSVPNTDGEALAKKGVVLVSVNHRLDILGFLDLSSFGGKWEGSVNVGMRDIVRALEWVRANAATFGGDPDNITIFGESGGGGKVGTLMNMPEAKGLFSKAIIQSGAKVNITTKEISEKLGRHVVEELGLTAETLDQIQTVPFETLMAAGRKVVAEDMGPRTPGSIQMWGFVPTPDGKILLEQPYTPGFHAQASDIPVLIGSTFNELERMHYTEADLDMAKAQEMLVKKYGEDGAREYMESFAEAYPDAIPADYVSTDSNIRALSLAAADSKSAMGGAPVYMFLLQWKSTSEVGQARACYHGLDIPLTFNNPYEEKGVIEEGDQAAALMADRMSDAWVNFAKTGNPNADSLPEWPAYDAESGAVMIFDNECCVKYNFDRRFQNYLTKELR